MKKVLFYCQHILGMGHLIRSMEIVRGMLDDFQVCFINGGQEIAGFPFPDRVKVVQIPAIKTDTEFQELKAVDESLTLEEVQDIRREKLVELLENFQPDIVIVELFPFGRRRFSPELIPFLEMAKAAGTKIVCSLRDIVVTKQNQQRHEEKVCKLMNKYFDLLLIHGDPTFIPLETSFSRVGDLNCEVRYTGYVTQPLTPARNIDRPLILVSVGGGRFGHNLLECMTATAPLLQEKVPHHVQMFTGPFAPEELLQNLQQQAENIPNLTVDRYTSDLLSYMQSADLSVSMSGYNTTLNVLKTGVRSMILPFEGNNDREQATRAGKLAELDRVRVIHPDDLQPERFAEQILEYLQHQPASPQFDFEGVAKTAQYLRQLASQIPVAA
ncbi:MAG: glycosyltransferase [Cyanobacteriota bacterium]|nr:glycosyltransferase [Cyanobacteriota bacterium]